MQDNRLIKTAFLLLTMVLAWSFFTGAARADMIVIANSDVLVWELDAGTAKTVFLGKKTKWGDGTSIIPVVLRRGPTHEAFLRKIVKRTPSQYSTFWKRAIFTGTGMPPKSFATEEEVVGFVRASPGAIGYVDSSTPHEGVKVLSIQ
jgi:ABC-type phosphate transport system substrate-binding protein